MQTPRELLFNALSGRPVDRVPVWLLFPYHQYPAYTDVRNHPAYRELAAASLREAVTLNRRNLKAPVYAPEVQEADETVVENGWQIQRHIVSWRDVRLFSEKRVNADGQQSFKKLLDNEDDLLAFCSLPLETDPARITAALDAQLPKYLREKAEFPKEAGAMMLTLGEPVGHLYSISNLTEYPVWSMTQHEAVEGHLEQMMRRLRIINEYCFARDLADVYFMVGAELATPPMMRPEIFRRWIVPYAKETIARIRERGAKSIQHCHGQLKAILPYIREMAPDGWHTVEAPPNGDTTLTEAFAALGDTVTLIGNIQYDDLRALTPEAMREAVLQVLKETEGRRFILSPTAGPFVPDPTPQMIRNYFVMLETAAQYRPSGGGK